MGFSRNPGFSRPLLAIVLSLAALLNLPASRADDSPPPQEEAPSSAPAQVPEDPSTPPFHFMPDYHVDTSLPPPPTTASEPLLPFKSSAFYIGGGGFTVYNSEHDYSQLGVQFSLDLNRQDARGTAFGPKTFGPRTYSNDHLDLGVGNGFVFAVHLTNGITIVGLRDRERFFPFFFAIEPLNLHAIKHSNTHLRSYIELQSMASAGIQFAVGPCKILTVGKIGDSIGTLGKGGVRPAYGIGEYLNCPFFNLDAEATRIQQVRHGAQGSIDMANASINFPILTVLSLGVRGEAVTEFKDNVSLFKLPGKDDRIDVRGLLSLQWRVPLFSK